MADETKRVIDQTTDTSLSAGDFVIIDSQSEGTRKFDLGTELTDIKQDLSDLQAEIEGGGGGLSADLKAALDQLAQKVAYIDEDGQTYYDALHAALYPPANLTRISCVYTQSGTVYDTDSLDSLKSDLVVTAHFSDGTTQIVTTYTLSGTLTEGTSTITVSYGGKTTTFNVTVSHYSLYEFYDYIEGDGTAFIDTGLSAPTYLADGYKKYIKFRANTLTSDKSLFGARNAWGTTGCLVQINSAGESAINVCFGNVWSKSSNLSENDLAEIELDYPYVKKDGQTIATVSNSTPAITKTAFTIPLFGMIGGESPSGSYVSYEGGYVQQICIHKIYQFTVTDKSNNTVIANIIPAKRNSDNAVGMYDTVRNVFMQNARNTGTLTLGNDS